uniref:Uncharacterized protein n=1 Tax=Lactuca sativa TaxID=4236 RepID=A0A9R1XB01_LACSA|nr:hypothetical protein LSAT_V11C500270660 [Lactuca sativa]
MLMACHVHPSVLGIPYVYSQAAIMYTQQDPVSYISSWFDKEKYMLTYGSNILSVNGSNLWVKSPCQKLLPPIERRMPGRLSIKRKRHVYEHKDKFSQVSSKGRTIPCKNYQQKGHNKVSCKNPKVIPNPKPIKKLGRPMLEHNLTHWKRGERG